MEQKINKFIYLVSFFEGAAVMATELCGTKLISPYFGSSLYVWSAVIAITLGSLASGYFYGGGISLKENRKYKLFIFLLLSSLYMGIMPSLSGFFGSIAVHFDLLLAVVLSASLLLFLPMFLMGAASPIIISLLTKNHLESGKVSGTVYSISTLGGISSSFLAGFLFIPSVGVYLTLIIFASLLTASLFLLIEKKNNLKILSALLLLFFFGFSSKTSSKNCIFESDGLLGKLNVIDDTVDVSKPIIIRKLLVNNVVQTEMEMHSHKSVSNYIQVIDSNTKITPRGKALVLGLGGGLTSNLLIKKKFEVIGVELDNRIIEIAQKFFYLSKDVVTVDDDARHYLNQTNDRYDLILIDIFKAEEQPVHVLTKESLLKIKSRLNPSANLIINWHGYIKDEKGLGTLVLLNTLTEAGFKYQICSDSNNEDERNLLFFCSIEQREKLKFSIDAPKNSVLLVNTDNQPLLEKYNVLANQTWRKNYIHYYYSAN